MSALADALRDPQPTTIADVVARMDAIGGCLPPADGIACFTRLYVAVTRAVEEAMRPGTFGRPEFLARLDVVFAQLYFDALRGFADAPGSAPKAWAPLFEARAQRGIEPLQFALAGMNAHINRDLPVALDRTSAELGLELRDGGPEHADYLRVNALLAETERRVRGDFVRGPVGLLDRLLGDADSAAAMWNVGRARDAAWTNARTLRALRGSPQLRREYLAGLDRMVGFAGRGLLRPARPRLARLAGRLFRR